MKYRKIGNTSLKASIIGFGCWGIGGESYGKTNNNDSIKALQRSYELGVNFFDTSDLYGKKDDGLSEKLIGFAFKRKRKKIIIATKFGLLPHNGWYMPENFNVDYLDQALHKSLKRLRTDYIDLMQLHSPSTATIRNKKKMNGIERYLKGIVKSGKIRFFGISVRTPEDGLYIAKNYKSFSTIQTNFNFIDQRAEENGLFDICLKKKIGIIARTPLVYGYLTGKINFSKKLYKGDHRKKWSKKQLKIWSDASTLFERTKSKNNQTLAQFCLQFCFSKKIISTTIPGMLNVDEVMENIKAIKFGLMKKNKQKEIFKIYKENDWVFQKLKKKV